MGLMWNQLNYTKIVNYQKRNKNGLRKEIGSIAPLPLKKYVHTSCAIGQI